MSGQSVGCICIYAKAANITSIMKNGRSLAKNITAEWKGRRMSYVTMLELYERGLDNDEIEEAIANERGIEYPGKEESD